MPSNVKTYDGSEDPEDHLKSFQSVAKVKCCAMPTWCHIYEPIEIHHIKQREGGSMEDFVQRFKTESRHVKGAPECMRILGFMHEITNLELIKRAEENASDMETTGSWAKTKFRYKGRLQESTKTNRRINQGWKVVARNQGAKTRKQKGLAESSKERRCFWEGQSYGDPNGSAMERVARQRITQSFSPDPEILFPPLGDEDGTKGSMITEAEIGGHFIHRMYVD
ncbi:hypothetical protein Tco_0804897 [Tanacetum coccineum]